MERVVVVTGSSKECDHENDFNVAIFGSHIFKFPRNFG